MALRYDQDCFVINNMFKLCILIFNDITLTEIKTIYKYNNIIN